VVEMVVRLYNQLIVRVRKKLVILLIPISMTSCTDEEINTAINVAATCLSICSLIANPPAWATSFIIGNIASHCADEIIERPRDRVNRDSAPTCSPDEICSSLALLEESVCPDSNDEAACRDDFQSDQEDAGCFDSNEPQVTKINFMDGIVFRPGLH